MKNKFSCIAILLFSLLITITSTKAQVKTKVYYSGVPKAKKDALITKATDIKIEPPKIFDKLLSKDTLGSDNIREYKGKFAVAVSVDIDIIKRAGNVDTGGQVVYDLTLIASKALNISLQFSEFSLSENSILSIFTENEITDSITAKENNQSNIWATRIYQGDRIHLMLKTPKNEVGYNKLKINQIGFGHKRIGSGFFGNAGTSSTCNINVLCPEGNGWQNERNSVALIVSNLSEICTGTLVMNTCGTNVPYLLTANHCLGGSTVQNWVFQFQTWSATCFPNGAFREDLQFNGCQLRANNAATDFALVELNQIPPSNSGLTYAGWTRAIGPALSSTCLHHPNGDLMKISLAFNPVVAVGIGGGAVNYWRATFNQGIVQFGSSGSALFDQNRRIVGQLYGNQNNICSNENDNTCWCTTQIPSRGEYGRFDLSWTGGGTNATRLSNWLDPTNTNAVTTNTANISTLPNVRVTMTGNIKLCVAETYSVNTTLPITWTSTPPGYVTFSCSPCSSTIATRATGVRGNITITGSVNTGCSAGLSVSKLVAVGSPVAIGYTKSPTCTNGFQTWNLNANPTTNGSNWVWTVGSVSSGSVINIYNPNSSGPQVNVNGFGAVRVNYTDQCGTAQQDGITVFSSCPSSLVVTPNPATNVATISLMESNTSQKPLGSVSLSNKKIYKINVLNKRGSIVKVFNYRSGINSASINLAGLINGTYTILAFDGSNWSSNQLVIFQ